MSRSSHSSPLLRALRRGLARSNQHLRVGRKSAASVAVESLEVRALLSGVPIAIAGVSVPTETFIGEDFDLVVTFDNTGTAEGYGPILDVVLPTNGADGSAGGAIADGLTTTGPATYLGLPVTTTEIVFPDGGSGTGTVDHPYFVDNAGTPLQVAGTAGDTLVVMQLPFGSFTADQPAADLILPVSMSDFADLNTPLSISARAGFQYGCDPVDNPASDPSLVSDPAAASATWTSQTTTTPILTRLTKQNLAPEMETATGPNFVRTYEIVVEVAEGQTITDFDVTDLLPPEIVYGGDATVTVTPSLGETILTSPNTDQPYAAPDNELTVRIPSVTGGTDNVGFTLTFDFYVDRLNAAGGDVLDPNTGDDFVSLNDASAIGDWTPRDSRDAGGTDNVIVHEEVALHDDELEDRSIAIQKSVANVTDGIHTPGDVLEYTLQFQISDFFAFQDVTIDDLLSDGQRFDDGFLPTITFSEHGSSISTSSFSLVNFTVADNFSDPTDAGNVAGNPSPPHIVDPLVPLGSQELRFRVSDEIASRTGFDGLMLGGCVPVVGTGSGAPDCGTFNGGATVGTIVYRTIIQENFSDDHPSTDASVDQGDRLTNLAEIDGQVLQVSDATTPTGFREADGTGASVVIARGMLSKSIYAINGSTTFTTPIEVTPGDTVTYRFLLDLPSSDVEDLEFVDYLPLPLLDATELTGVDDVQDAAAPAAGRIKFGPTDTFSGGSGISGIIPVLSQLPGNAFSLLYGNYDNVSSSPSNIDLLLTVTVEDEAFADGLFHTNQVRQLEGSTNQGANQLDSIVQIRINEPELHVTKGVVASSNPAASLTAAAGPVTFSAPGSGGYRGNATIHSNGLAATPVNANLTDSDAGDLVTFALVVENTGSSRRGAFDIQLRDTLPAGFSVPAGGLNLNVSDGTGVAMAFTALNVGDPQPLFGSGIEINDPGATAGTGDGTDGGALDEFDATDGRNVLVITYDLVADADVEPGETITNVVTLSNYAAIEGGDDFTPSDLTEDATVTMTRPDIQKDFVSTNQPHTSDVSRHVAIGEIVTYTAVVTVPEGISTGVSIVDTLDSGLAFVNGSLSITPSSGAITFTGAGTESFSNFGSGTTAPGRRMTIDLGTVTNSNVTTATTLETLTVTYQAVVLNSTNNNRNNQRNNNAVLNWSQGNESDGAQNVRIVEPQLQVSKTFAPDSGQAGETKAVTLVLSHHSNSNTDAFDVELTDILPAGMAFAGGLSSSGLAPTSLSESSGTITATYASFGQADTSTITFNITLESSVVPGTSITNDADAEWTSLPGDVTSSQTTTNTLGVERTGDTSDPGGSANDHTATGSDDMDIIVPVPTKSIVSTSQAHTAGANVAVGEIVRYRLSAVVPQGTATNFRMIDALPTGLSFHAASGVNVSWVADNDITEAADLAGADNDATPPTFALPAGRISTAGSTVTFDLGTLVNNDNDAGVETIILEFSAIADNIAANSVPFTHDNTFDVEVDGTVTSTSPPVTTTLVEPAIANVAKSVVDMSATDRTFEVTFSNTGTATAFDVAFADNLPATLGLQLASVSISQSGGATGLSDTSVGNDVLATVASMPVGSSITVRYTADVLSTNTTMSNTADVTFTSLPGGSPDERTGAGGVNDHSDGDTEQLGSLGNLVWLDNDNDGIVDGSELGIAGVDVELVWPGPDGDFGTAGDNVTLTTTTNDNGFYRFNALPASDYRVSVLTPSLPGTLAPTDDLDGTGTPHTATASLSAGQVRNDFDFGYHGPGSIGDTIFLDVDNDGVPDSGEGITGVDVTLTGDFDGDGLDEVLTATTDASGNYLFDGLITNDRLGGGIDYTIDVVTATLPPSLTQTVDPNGGLDNTSAVTLTDASPDNLAQDFGYRGTGSIGDTIFLDVDNDGVPDSDEGIAGVDVTLTGDFDSDGVDEVLTTTTDNSGNYLFPGLVTNDGAGGGVDYTVTVVTATLPSAVTNTVDPDGGLNNASTVTLTDAVQNNLAQDFGYRGLGSIGDTIFLDVDNNGAPDSGEGISGVDVVLTGDFDGDGIDESLTTTTNASGGYLFDGLITNDGLGSGIDYTVAVQTATLPVGVANTVDPDGGLNSTSDVTLTDVARNNLAQDFGYRGLGLVGDTIFLDLDNDGIPDANEGFANVDVTLTGDFDGDGTDEVLTATTNNDGVYGFSGLVTNDGLGGGIDYTVDVLTASLPGGVTNTVDPNGGLDNTSDVTLTDAAPTDLLQDFGYRGPGSIGDTIFLDTDNDGTPSSGEGITGVGVTLTGDFDGDGVGESHSTTTDASGSYVFDGLVTNDGAGGGVDYTVTVQTGTLPAGVTNTVDPDGGLNDTSDLTLTDAARHDLAQDFGYRGPGSIGDTIFLDVDNDSTPDPGEGISGVDVTLAGDFDGDGTDEVLTTTTDVNGNYLFGGLITNDGTGGGIDYTVTVVAATLPAGVIQTVDPNGGLDNTSTVTLTDGAQDDLAQDFGYRGSGSIGDTIFLDVDNDGTLDGDEGVAGVDVTLTGDFDGDGVDEILTTTTDNDGNYLFQGLVTNDGVGGGINYSVAVVAATLPDGVNNTVDPDGGLNSTSATTLTDAAPDNLAQDFGYRGPGSIGDTIFLDVDNDGVHDAGEGISGVDVTLTSDFDGDGVDETITTTTDGAGNYLFDGLITNDGSGGGIDYTVTVVAATLPAGVTQTVDPNGGLDNTSSVTLTDAAQDDLAQDFGYRGTGSIGDTIFLDLDSDGVPGGDEGIASVDVTLTGDFDGDGTDEVLTTTTDNAGNYLFPGLVTNDGAGGGVDYTVTVVAATLPDGVANTADPNGGLDNRSDVTLTDAVATNLAQDFGYRGQGSIGDTVFLDVDNDGTPDAGEGISGVDVVLSGDFDGDGVDELHTVTTDADGNYLFDGLVTNDGAGGGIDYTVTVQTGTLPSGVTSTVDPDGGLDDASDVTLTDATQGNLAQDFGYRGIGSIGDTIFLDVDDDGTPGPGEGISGVDVTLAGDFDGDGTNEVLTTTTDANGNYLFPGLVTNDGAGGGVSYTVTVVAATLPTGVTQTVDPNGGLDNRSTVTLTDVSPNDLAQDFGYRGQGSIGDTIFLDVNNDGAPDSDEGIAGVDVTLTGDFDGDGVDEVLATTTDNDGNYLFPGLVTNNGIGGGIDYTVDVVTATLPSGVANTVDPDGGLNDTANVTLTDAAQNNLAQDFGYRGPGSIGDTIFLDVDNDGTPDSGEGLSGVDVTLTGDFDDDGLDETLTTTTDAAGNYLFDGLITNDGAGGGIDYIATVQTATLPAGVSNTVDPDGGLDNTSSVTLTDAAQDNLAQDFGYRGPGSIGDTIFLDVDNDGVPSAGEGIAGVDVTLTGDFDGDGVAEVLTTTTDNDGDYLFPGLVTNDGAGGGIDYTVGVVMATLPAGVTNTVDPDGGLDSTSEVTLTDAVQNDLAQDFGYRGLGSIGDTIFLDINNDGVPDAGEGISGVDVTLTGDFDGDGVDESLTTTTDASGNYLFDGLITNDGAGGGIDYTVTVQTGTLPAGVTNTVDPNGGLDNTADVTLSDATPGNLSQDFGYRGTGSIGDRVFIDANNSTLHNSGEGITGATVTLTGDFDGDGNDETVSTTTGVDGFYEFNGLITNDGTGGGIDYIVDVVTGTLPAGVVNTVDPDGGLDGSSLTTLTDATPDDAAQDFGYQTQGEIGDTIFLDINGNGLPDPGEGISGVTVTLTGDLDGDMIDDVLTATTGSRGTYLFEGLPVTDGGGGGISYRVEVQTATLPLGITNTTDPDGGNDNISIVTLTNAMEEDYDQDFGYRGIGTVGDIVFLDANGNGLPDPGEGIADVTVELVGDFDGDGRTEKVKTTTGSAGGYSFTGLPVDDGAFGGIDYRVKVDKEDGAPGTTIPAGLLNTVDPDGGNNGYSALTLTNASPANLDQDFGYQGPGAIGDTVFLDSNGNGLPDAGEGISGVEIELKADHDNDGRVETLRTITDANGRYSFEGLPVVGAGFGIRYRVKVDRENRNTLPEGVVNTTDPDGGSNHRSDTTLTVANPANFDQDFGYRGPGEVGDTIFLDINNNGLPDSGEGLDDVTVELVGDFDGDGRNEVLRTTTSADGTYGFEGLPVDDGAANGLTYKVKVDKQVGAVGTTLPLGVNNTTDPDGGNNGRSDVTISNASPIDLGQDFGYRGPGRIGDRIFLDEDGDTRFDSGEGIGGVRVTLTGDFDGDGTNETVETTTNPSGRYEFTGLPVEQGIGGTVTYDVTVDGSTLPSSYVPYVDPDGGLDDTSSSTLSTANPTDLDQDFAYVDRVDLAVTKDNTHEFDIALPGEDFTYEIVVTNNGPGIAPNAKVVDKFPSSIASASWTATGSAGTIYNSSGSGDIIELVTIPSGGTITYTVTAQTAANFAGQIINKARVKTQRGQVDTDPSNNLRKDITSVADVNLIPLNNQPPVAGEIFTLSASGQTSDSSLVTFFVSPTLGSHPVPGTNLTLGLQDPITIGVGFLCDANTIEVLWDVPEEFAGQTLHYQALETDPDPQLSNVLSMPTLSSGSGSGGSGNLEVEEPDDSRHSHQEHEFLVQVAGTSAADDIRIYVDGSNISVTVNGQQSEFNNHHVQVVEVNAGAGNDRVLITGSSQQSRVSVHANGEAGSDLIRSHQVPLHADGGTGNDTLIGSDRDDSLEGGTGNDWLLGRGGDDVLDGGAGNDRALGHRGADVLLGREGDDVLRGGIDNDLIVAGTGFDRMFGDAGDDVLAIGSIVDAATRHQLSADWRSTPTVDSIADHLVIQFASQSQPTAAHGNSGNDTLFASLLNVGNPDLRSLEQIFDEAGA